jgi:hypothetical protein
MRGRPALLPYDAMVCLLHQIHRGRLDGQAVRAFLRCDRVIRRQMAYCGRLAGRGSIGYDRG